MRKTLLLMAALALIAASSAQARPMPGPTAYHAHHSMLTVK